MRSSPGTSPSHPRVLHLFSGPYVTYGRRRVNVPEGSKRLLVFVALHRGRVERRYAAGALWPSGDEERAVGNLRSALWRLRGAGIQLLSADNRGLVMRDDVFVDVCVVSAWAARLIGGSATCNDLGIIPWGADALDLLPGWYDEWVLMERERIRQRLLHALEALSHELVKVRRCAEAVAAADVHVARAGCVDGRSVRRLPKPGWCRPTRPRECAKDREAPMWRSEAYGWTLPDDQAVC